MKNKSVKMYKGTFYKYYKTWYYNQQEILDCDKTFFNKQRNDNMQ